MKQFERSIADCEKTLQLNPYHFGAMAGMAQSYMQMRKHKAALKAFRTALRINPNLTAWPKPFAPSKTRWARKGARTTRSDLMPGSANAQARDEIETAACASG